MSEEEKKSIEEFKRWVEFEKKNKDKINNADLLIEVQEIILNLIENQQKEISLLKEQLEYVKSEYEETIEQQQKEIEELKNTETYKIAIIDKDKYVSKDKIREIIEGDYTNLWKILEIEKMLEE